MCMCVCASLHTAYGLAVSPSIYFGCFSFQLTLDVFCLEAMLDLMLTLLRTLHIGFHYVKKKTKCEYNVS